MARISKTEEEKAKALITEFGNDFTTTPLGLLFCRLCNTLISSKKKFWITAHIETKSINQN